MKLFLSTVLSTIVVVGSSFSYYSSQLISENKERTIFSVELGEPYIRYLGDGFAYIGMEDFGPRGEEFGPQLFGRSFAVAVPKGSNLNAQIEFVEWSDWFDFAPASLSDETNHLGIPGPINKELYNKKVGGNVEFTGIINIRNVEIACIDLIPVQYDPQFGTRFMRYIEISVDHHGGGTIDCGELYYHHTFEAIYRAMLVNPESALPRNRPSGITEWNPSDGAELLVITRSVFIEEIQPWVDWKLWMGLPTRVVRTDSIGNTVAQIKAYIQNAYNTWTLKPAYLLLVGDADNPVCYTSWTNDTCVGDTRFGCVAGSDYVMDIHVGRISADNETQVSTIVQKHINYEKQPNLSNTWYLRAVGVVNEDDCPPPLGPVDSSYLAAVQYAINQCASAGYLSYPLFRNCSGHTSSSVSPYTNAGCNFVVYRGQAYPDWYSPFNGLHPYSNSGLCPITVSVTCVTGGFQSGDNNLCEVSTRAGTVSNPTGSVAWIGQAVVSSYSMQRSSLSKNIFVGLFPSAINQIGAADTYGRYLMHVEFGWSNAGAKYEYLTSTLIGSPEMLAWTANIRTPVVTHPTSVTPGANNIIVNVQAGGSPVNKARIALHNGSAMSYGMTNSLGNDTISINVDPAYPLTIVVTGPNISKYENTITVVLNGIFTAPVTFTDIVGDGDGRLNPGETIRFFPRIFNSGMSTMTLSAKARCNDPSIIWIDSTTNFPPVASGDTVAGDEVRFQIPPNHLAVSSVTFILYITGGTGGPWTRDISPEPAIHRFVVTFDSLTIRDPSPYGNGNGALEAGEVVDICIRLKNSTQAQATNVVGRLAGNSLIEVIQDSGIVSSFPIVSSQTLSPCFKVSVSPLARPGEDASTKLYILGQGSIYTYNDTLNISLTVGGNRTSLPTGPDSYGYYIIDNTDISCGLAPTYVWNEIRTIGTLFTPINNQDDGITVFPLPFRMRFYGSNFDTISVSSNGFVVPGRSTWSGSGSGSPQEFPTVGGPIGVIAPAWADLAPHRTNGGEIYRYYDTANNQFVIEWDSCQFYYPTSGSGFINVQLKICDPNYWPTPTGDSEFYIYYNPLNISSGMGVGIESPSQTIGLMYYRNGVYDVNAAELINGRALRITTSVPSSPTGPWLLYHSDLFFDDSLGNRNRLAEPGEIIGLRMRIINRGNAIATNTQGIVISTSKITTYGGAVPFGNVAVGGTAYNTFSMKFTISPSCPPDTLLEVPIRLTANGGAYTTYVIVKIRLGTTIEVQEIEILPEGISLGNAYPNPFNGTTSIEVFVGKNSGSPVNISLFNIDGRKVSNVFDGYLPIGKNNFRISSNGLPSGIYFVRLCTDEFISTRKIILIE